MSDRELSRALARAATIHDVRTALHEPLTSIFGASAVFVASADPETWLVTDASSVQVPSTATRLFLDNEYGMNDLVKFRHVAESAQPVQTLHRATRGQLHRSARWREILEPLGWGDEMRAAVRVDGLIWGFLCLHRARADPPFSEHDVSRLRRMLPRFATEFRRAAGAAAGPAPEIDGGPGVLLLDPRGPIIASNEPAAHWLDELRKPGETGSHLALMALAHASLRHPASVDLRTSAGRWVTLHASPVRGVGPARVCVCVVIEPTRPDAAMPRLAALTGLTAREREVTAAVVRGRSTRTIAEVCHISEHTVREHLKSVFKKTGVHSRRELVARVMSGQ